MGCYKISVVGMRMLRWITEKIRKYRLQNEEICLKIGMTPINEKKRRVT